MSEPAYDGRTSGPIHLWFSLSYASYLVLPRVVLQSMPIEWQERLVACLRELEDEYGGYLGAKYQITVRGKDGRYQRGGDGLPPYRHSPPLPARSWYADYPEETP